MIRKIAKIFLIFLSLILCFVVAQFPSAQTARVNSIVQITDGIYRGSNGIWHNLIYVSDEGILLVDTLNPEFASWLKQELAQIHPGVVVKYVVYSHSHFDHVEGGSVFADTAIFIAHKTMLQNMDGRFPHMPGDMIDRNNNGMFEPEEYQIPSDEAPGVCGGFYPKARDTNNDGHLTPQEYFAEVLPPNIVYDDRMTLIFGDQAIELIHPGRNHSDDATVVYFPEQRLLFGVDFLADALTRDTMHSLPSACGPFDGHAIGEWIESYKKVEEIDFDILTTGHGHPLRFSKQDVTDTREYFEYLRDEVSTAISTGLNLQQMQETILLEKYSDWDQYERLREKNIEAAFNNLMNY